MTPRDTTTDDRRLTRRQRTAFALIAVVCILLAGATVAVAQQQTFSDDFEDQSAEGWEDTNGNEPPVVQEGGVGNWSIHADESDATNFVQWTGAPPLSLSEEFTLEAVVKSDQGGENLRTRVGLIERPEGQSVGPMLIFSQEYGATYLATAYDDSPTDDAYNGDFSQDPWVNIEMHSDGDGALEAKVWRVNESEPSSYELNRSFSSPSSAPFAVDPGASSGSSEREMWLDQVSVNGTPVPDSEALRLDVPGYLPHNDTGRYAVKANQSGVWRDVTEDANVTPSNPDAVTFYPSNGTVVASGNKSINERVDLTAEYQGLNATDYMVVATPTVNNLDLLPAWWSVNAVLSDWTMIWILLATLIATAASRMATTFAGIGGFVMAMIMGWIMGDVPDGIMVATTFMGIFIGLNLAANIDYSVR